MLYKKSNNPKGLAFELSLHKQKNVTICEKGKKELGEFVIVFRSVH